MVGVLTTALVVASLAYSVYDTSAHQAAAYFVTTTQMWELGIGGLLAIAPAWVTTVLGRQWWLGWLGLAAVLASGRLPDPDGRQPATVADPPRAVSGVTSSRAGSQA